ncbi:MAG: MtrB/PioB family decaheme-associated outer membrane protein [Methylococcales bacterium]|nr:MtrB/PioB family decaheme-associated outer membrane protein [Methylococcales bacterium]
MKIRHEKMNVKILSLAVRSALMAAVALPLGAYADDAADLKRPTNTIEAGSLYSSQNSARFGQYNGLNDEGFYGLGGFDVRGGEGYDDSKDSALRWKLGGSNLGTTSRALDGSLGEQGQWKINLGYDELQHNITNSFQTPQQGDPDGNNFTLPANFGTINSATGQGGTRSLTPAQSSAFQTEQEYVNRKNGSVSTSYTFSPQLSAQFDYNHLDQSGAKLIGTGSQGGINVGRGNILGKAEGNNILMNPTSYTTDNVNAALNWTGEKGHITGGYYGSLFHDDYNSLSWQSAMANGAASGTSNGCVGANCYVNNTMSTAPSNTMHQANLTGGYNFSSNTKVAGGFSYGYNEQNASYAPTNILQANGTSANMMMGGLPASSLNGVVETTHGDLKLTNQSIDDLTLSAGFKFNQRDNSTPSNAYNYYNLAASSLKPGTSAAPNTALYQGVNTPYSNSKTQYEAVAAYRLSKAQNINLTYDHESVKRWCNGVLGGAQCVASPASEEDKISLTYRLKVIEAVNFNAGYTYANRRADTSNFLANAGNYASQAAVSGSAFNAGNFLGYAAYPYVNRDQNLGKAGINWQATEKLDLGVNGRYTYDNYDATLGVQNAHSAGVNVDATYSYAENSSVSAYWNWQNGQRNLSNGASGNGASQTVAATNIWNNQLEDNSNSVGLTTRRGGLLNGNLELIGDLSYALDTSSYSTQVPYATTVPCGNTTQLTCGNVSPISNELISLKFTGNYKVHKNGKLSLTYMYQKLNSNDYFYNGQQFGYTPNSLMPTGLQPQSYTVNVVGLSYNYSF